MAVHSLEDRAETLHRGPGALVGGIGPESDPRCSQVVEGMAEQEKLGLRVHEGSPPWASVPRRTDLDASVGRRNVQVAARSNRSSVLGEHDREGQALARGSLDERSSHPRLDAEA